MHFHSRFHCDDDICLTSPIVGLGIQQLGIVQLVLDLVDRSDQTRRGLLNSGSDSERGFDPRVSANAVDR